MQPLDQTSHDKMKNFTRNFDKSGFRPAHTYTYNSGTNIVVVTDGSAIPGGVAWRRSSIEVHDEFGNKVVDQIAAAGGNTGNIDVSGLDASKGLHITATIVLDNGWTGDGSVKNIVDAGVLGGWAKNESAAQDY